MGWRIFFSIELNFILTILSFKIVCYNFFKKEFGSEFFGLKNFRAEDFYFLELMAIIQGHLEKQNVIQSRSGPLVQKDHYHGHLEPG